MKSRLTLAAAIAALSVAHLSGCASKAERAESESIDSARSFRTDLAKMPNQIDETMTKLYQATDPTNANRATAYDSFSRELTYLQQDAKKVSASADEAKADRETFFREWNREAVKSDPSKRDMMNQTQSTRNINYDHAVSYLDGAKQNYRDLVSQLNDINRALGSDLSKFSSTDVQNGLNNATLKANNLKNYIARLTEQIDSALADAGE